jgi:hypothetical protein
MTAEEIAAFASQLGPTYQIQHSPALSDGSRTKVGTVQAGNGGVLQLILPVSIGGKDFYRTIISRP